MRCSQCDSDDTIATDRIQTVDGTVTLWWCLDCLTESEDVPPERYDVERDRKMMEEKE